MKSPFNIPLIACALALASFAAFAGEDTNREITHLEMLHQPVKTILISYEVFSDRELVIASDVASVTNTVTVRSGKGQRLSSKDAAALIRKALLEQAGVVVTPIGEHSASVTYNGKLVDWFKTEKSQQSQERRPGGEHGSDPNVPKVH